MAEKLKELYDFLVIGDYEESHAARYPRLAHTISRHPESIVEMKDQDRLNEISGIAGIITKIVTELLETGTCTKMEQGDEFFTPPPRSVLQLTKIPKLGAKKAKLLYQEHGIDSLNSLAHAVESGELLQIKGFGKGMVATIEKYIADHSA